MSRGEPSTLRAALRLAMHGLRARGADTGASGPVPRRRHATEQRGIAVDPKRAEAYLRVTDGARIPALNGNGALLSPAYPALWETALAMELLAQAGLPFPSGGLIHLGGELVHLRPLAVGDMVRCRLEIDRVERDPRGLRLALVGRNWNAAGQLCTENTTLLLLRVRGAEEGRREAPRAVREEVGLEPASWEEVARWSLPGGHGRRYARVSGDYSPIHLWPWSSRPFGYRRPVLHGYCTEAMVAHALIERRLGGDPVALRRLQIAFRAPLALPARVRLLAAVGEDGGGGRFRVEGEDGTRRPFAEGTWVGSG